jgi:hypothetical protein
MFRAQLLAVTAIFVLLSGCRNADTQAGTVHHVVICWLKEPGNREAQEKLISVSRGLGKIPGVVSVSAGRILPSDRPVVDSTFDVAMVFTFKDKDALAKYLERPEHKKATKETLEPLVKKILIYDFEE